MTIRQETEPGLGPFFWKPEQSRQQVGLSVQAGDSALLTEFLRALLPVSTERIEGVTLDPALLKTPTAPITCSWTLWQQAGDKFSGFRIAEWTNHEKGAWEYARHALKRVPQLLVIEDSGLGFRDQRRSWRPALSLSSRQAPEQILLKLSIYGAGERSPVLDRIRERGLAGRTTVVVSVSDIRACAVRVSESLSWERMLEGAGSRAQ